MKLIKCFSFWQYNIFKPSSRSSRTEVFCKKGVLRNFAKFTGKHLCQSLFFNKVAGLRMFYGYFWSIIFTLVTPVMFYGFFFQFDQLLTPKARWQSAYVQDQKKSQTFFIQLHHLSVSPSPVSLIKKGHKNLRKSVATDNALLYSSLITHSNRFSTNVPIIDKPGSSFLLAKCLKNNCGRVAF